MDIDRLNIRIWRTNVVFLINKVDYWKEGSFFRMGIISFIKIGSNIWVRNVLLIWIVKNRREVLNNSLEVANLSNYRNTINKLLLKSS